MPSSRLVAPVLAFTAVACSTPAAQGGEGQACYPNGTCNTGLTCASHLCVALPGDGGPSDAGAPVDAPMSPDAGGDAFVAPPSAQPPVSSGPHATDGTTDVTLAITRLRLGDTFADGTPDTGSPRTAWGTYGYDLDHVSSTASSTDHCRPLDGAAPSHVFPDGPDGVDNSFGERILPILLGLANDFPTRTNDAIASGGATQLLTIDHLGSGDHYDPLAGRILVSLALGAAPHFDGTDTYTIDPSSLASPPTIASAIVSFADAYLVGNTLVARPSSSLVIALGGTSTPFAVQIAHPIVTLELDATHRHGTRGIIAGVAPTSALTMAMRQLAGSFDPSLCSGPTIDSIVTQIEQASDILATGGQDPTMDCDAISIGLGFDAELVQLGAVGSAVSPPPSPCP